MDTYMMTSSVFFKGTISADCFYFEDLDVEHPRLEGVTGYGDGGKGSAFMYFELGHRKIDLKEGPAILEIRPRDKVMVEYIVKNSQ